MSTDFDVIVIGSGAAGLSAAVAGASVMIMEANDKVWPLDLRDLWASQVMDSGSQYSP